MSFLCNLPFKLSLLRKHLLATLKMKSRSSPGMNSWYDGSYACFFAVVGLFNQEPKEKIS